MSFIDKAEGLERGLSLFRRADFGQNQTSILLLKSHRHTQAVEILRFACPALGIFLIIFYIYTLVQSRGAISYLPQIPIPHITTKDLAMQNPIYEGVTKDGGSYRLTAEVARQDFSNMNVVKLEKIKGELTQLNKQKTYLTAERGTFDQKENILKLEEKIDIKTDDGVNAQLTSAIVKTKEGVITSNQPVRATFPAGTIESQELLVLQKEHKISFLRDVICHLKPNTKSEKEHATQSEKKVLFGSSNAPLNITSSQLDIDDYLKTATFIGDVKADQEGASLEAPQMVVHYVNDQKEATKEKLDEASNPQEAEVKHINISGPFSLIRDNKDKVTGNSAEFNTVEQVAHLQGNIHITSPPDRHVTADWAELDQKEDSALLTGNVTVINGETLLKGQHLFLDRKKSRSFLSSPPLNGGAGGRISAHFVRKNSGVEKTTLSPKASNTSAFGLNNLQSNPEAPIEIEASSLDVNDQEKTALFRDNVHVKQGGIVMISSTLKAYYTGKANLADPEKSSSSAEEKNSNQLTRMEAKENVHVTTPDGRKVKGDWATFDAKSNSTIIGGDVELTQDSSVIRGTRLVIDMTTNSSTIDSASAQSLDPTLSSPWEPRIEGKPQTKTNRPSAIFFPNEFREKKD